MVFVLMRPISDRKPAIPFCNDGRRGFVEGCYDYICPMEGSTSIAGGRSSSKCLLILARTTEPHLQVVFEERIETSFLMGSRLEPVAKAIAWGFSDFRVWEIKEMTKIFRAIIFLIAVNMAYFGGLKAEAKSASDGVGVVMISGDLAVVTNGCPDPRSPLDSNVRINDQ